MNRTLLDLYESVARIKAAQRSIAATSPQGVFDPIWRMLLHAVHSLNAQVLDYLHSD